MDRYASIHMSQMTDRQTNDI